MISEMAQKLKEILSNTSQEEFDRDWAGIEDLGFQGPHADEVIEYLTFTQPTTVSYEVQPNNQNTLLLSNNSYYTAA
ncbi:hypothetical protein [Mucilaginibacter arboris]|uniref:Uncharacterized protein n=1 Tax=Mucilaginibacter arboris TaxID=2682090 RepID=A0A7K1SUT6_9SPHI|nr:hypothetical protein [Mucilaginibacter arboris]MVN20800.1 hypothetical protein [Mucilaginibacter arboris]